MQGNARSRVGKEEPRKGAIPGKVSWVLLKALANMTYTSKFFSFGIRGSGHWLRMG